jgi:hypothetical protein
VHHQLRGFLNQIEEPERGTAPQGRGGETELDPILEIRIRVVFALQRQRERRNSAGRSLERADIGQPVCHDLARQVGLREAESNPSHRLDPAATEGVAKPQVRPHTFVESHRTARAEQYALRTPRACRGGSIREVELESRRSHQGPRLHQLPGPAVYVGQVYPCLFIRCHGAGKQIRGPPVKGRQRSWR